MHPGLCFAAKFALTARSPEQTAFFDVADGFDPFSLFIEIAFNPAFIVHLADFEDFLADIRLGQETVGIPAVTPRDFERTVGRTDDNSPRHAFWTTLSPGNCWSPSLALANFPGTYRCCCAFPASSVLLHITNSNIGLTVTTFASVPVSAMNGRDMVDIHSSRVLARINREAATFIGSPLARAISICFAADRNETINGGKIGC